MAGFTYRDENEVTLEDVHILQGKPTCHSGTSSSPHALHNMPNARWSTSAHADNSLLMKLCILQRQEIECWGL